jgi:hypothetical protein
MRLLNNTCLCLEVEDFVALGYTAKTVASNISANRASWRGIVAVPDPSDKRRSLYVYDSLPLDKRNQVQDALTNGENPLTWYLKREQFGVLRTLLPSLPEADKRALKGYQIQREVADLATGEALTKKKSGLPEEKIREYGQACRWLAFMSSDAMKSKTARAKINPAFASMPDFYNACAEVFKADGVKLPTNYAKLVAKLKEYKTEGAACVVSKLWGNPAALKIQEEQLDYLIKLYSDQRKPTFGMVTGWYNEAALLRQELGLEMWPTVTDGTVKNQLMDASVQPVWWMERHGFDSWKSKFEYTMLCHRPTARDIQWVIDGTKVNKRYRTAKGISAQLKVLAVMDVSSECFIGWSFSEKEDSQEVAVAVRMATRRAGGVRPHQFLYDGDRSNRAFFNGMAGLHYKAMPYNGQSKTIEGVFKRLQTQVLKADLNFTGQNIKSVSKESRENPDILTKDFVNKLPTLEECMAQAEKELHIWNNKPGRDGKSPKQRYEGSQNPHPQVMTLADEVDAFWVWNDQAIQYRKDGLRMRHQGRDHVFEVVEEMEGSLAQLVPDLAFHSQNVGRHYWIKYDPEAIGDRVALYIGEDKRFVGFAQAKQSMPRAVADYTPTSKQDINARLVTKKLQAQAVLEKQANITERLDAEDQLKLGHRWLDKGVESAAEEDFLAAQEHAPRPRKLPVNSGPVNIGGAGEDRHRKAAFLENLSFDDE